MEGARKFLDNERVDVVIHHSPCDDGHAAAALFYDRDTSVTLCGLHPKDELLTPEVCALIRGKTVVFVDIAWNAHVMTAAASLARKVIVLDHHVTNQTSLATLELPNVRVVFEMDVAGVALAWRFLRGDEEVMPRALYYIALKDVWKHESVQEAVYFTTAFVRPESWEGWACYIDGSFEHIVDNTIERGRIIYDYQRAVLRTMMEKVEYLSWRGYRIAMVNVPFPWNSDIGAMMCETEPERTIAVVWNKPATGPYSVSLRTHAQLGPNVEQIALEFKGGGHAHAAGLRLERAPYEVFCDK
jgi:oligoribonuclease NrnB/cAMP/cGMP phosphodiesterase (DHH superfamily)